MPCEICGFESARKRVIIDGSELSACDNCAKFGKEISEQPKIIVHSYERHEKEHGLPELKDLKDNYGEIIRKARESKGFTIEDLANSMFENASWLKKIEHGALKPDAKLISKLEKTLSIKLMGD